MGETRRREEYHVKIVAEAGVTQAQTKENLEPPEMEEARNNSPLISLESPSEFQTSSLHNWEIINFYCFKPSIL